MAFSDWDFFGPPTEALQPSSAAIVGSSSLEVTGNNSQAWQGQLNSGFSRGFTIGKIRTLMNVESTSDPTNLYPGIFCMSESENVTAITNDLYAVAVNPNNVSGNVQLKKLNNGILDFDSESVLGSSQIDFTVGNTIALELEWLADVDQIGGVLLRVRTGTELDYSDLSEVITYVDVSSPYTSTFAEGIMCHFQSGVGVSVILFDETIIFEGS